MIGLEHQHGRRFIVLKHQYDHRDVMWNCYMVTFSKTCDNILDFPLTYVNTFIGLDNRIVLNLAW